MQAFGIDRLTLPFNLLDLRIAVGISRLLYLKRSIYLSAVLSTGSLRVKLSSFMCSFRYRLPQQLPGFTCNLSYIYLDFSLTRRQVGVKPAI